MISPSTTHGASSVAKVFTMTQTETYVPYSSYDQRPAPSGAFGRYVVQNVLGRGGMGVVLRAYDPALEREVALKVLTRDRLGDGAPIRLVREARAMAQMSHENVVGVYDVDRSRADMVIVMELVRGRTLREWLEHARPTQDEIIERFVQAGQGLAAAHDVGILHRDFKPSNVLIPHRGPAKVTDFGLAKVARPPRTTPSVGASAGGIWTTLTRDGTVMGTPRYMAPEQHQGKALTPAVDQYALCVALWEALLGSPPYAMDSYEQMVMDKLCDPVSWPAGSSVPRRIARAICRGLAVDPVKRWPSMRALLDALAPAPAPVRRRRSFVASVGALVFVVLGGLAGTASTTLRPRVQAQPPQHEGVAPTSRSPRRVTCGDGSTPTRDARHRDHGVCTMMQDAGHSSSSKKLPSSQSSCAS
ncbi:MAG: serine/threonine-protein kinase [Myxococcota bacterium]